jgi:PDZ domain-containing protein/peptidase S41-like protein
MHRIVSASAAIAIATGTAAWADPTPVELRSDAQQVPKLINDNYAYLEQLPGGRLTVPPRLESEARHINTMRDLVRYSERVISLLADHHAITGSSLHDSWAIVPSYADLWITKAGTDYVVDQVRDGSPAAKAGIRPRDRLLKVDGVSIEEAVADFWNDLGATGGGERDAYAARVLAAGRRDRTRSLTLRTQSGIRSFNLPNLYTVEERGRGPLTVQGTGHEYLIRFNDSLGDQGTIAAFDKAMTAAPKNNRVVIDLRDTPSGGNTSVARAILGWFVRRASFYQMHNLPIEERQTGIARQWVEQVLPRPGKYYGGSFVVRVGRWTGSMGEGLGIGFHAIGARVEGTRMAGLKGAVDDYKLPASGLVLKIPTERLYTVDGIPREKFVPSPMRRGTH